MKGLRKGGEAAHLWATRAPGGVAADDELEALFYEDGTEGGGGTAVALVVRRWRWEEDGAEASSGRSWPARVFALHDAGVSAGAPSQDRAEGVRSRPASSAARRAGVCGGGGSVALPSSLEAT